MTFSEILAAFYDECNYASSPATAVVTRAKRFVNEGIRVIVGEPGVSRLVDSDLAYEFATTASRARYAVPDMVATIRHITERTNDLALIPMSLSEYRARDPDATSTTGTPTHYVPIGRVAVERQPADSSVLFVDSNNAGDTNTAYLETILSHAPGVRQRNISLTMTGITAVSSVLSIQEVTDFYLSVAAVGQIRLTEDTEGGTELAFIVPGQLRPRYYGFYLWPTPAAAVTYYVDYRRNLQELVNDTDEPPLPMDYHHMLVAYAVMREAEKTGDETRLARAAQRYTRLMQNLKYQIGTLDDDIPVVGRHLRSERRRFYDRATFPIA